MSSSYPFDKVWHRGRAIQFGPPRDAGKSRGHESGSPCPEIGMARHIHAAGTTASEVVEPPPVVHIESGLDHSDGGEAESFTTAPEDVDDAAPTAPTPAAAQAGSDGVKPKDKEISAAKKTIDTPVAVVAPKTKLEFNIPEPAFRAALAAPEGSPESYWSYDLYRAPPPPPAASSSPLAAAEHSLGKEQKRQKDRKVTVHYCKSKQTMERVCQLYFLNEPVLGFDLEWQPQASRSQGPRQNCSLIQLASPSRVALFHVALFPKSGEGRKDDPFVAPTFRRIMEDAAVSKAGVNIKSDCTRLSNYLGVTTSGIFELSHLYKLVKHSSTGHVQLVNKKLVSLATQVQECLGLPLFKGGDVRESNWNRPLNLDQVTYSASDAYAGLQLYHVLDEARQALDPVPPRPRYAEEGLPIRLAPGVTVPRAKEPADGAGTGGGNSSEATTEKAITPAPSAPRVATSSSLKARPKDPRVTAAEVRVAEHRASNPRGRATYSSVRCYFIWNDNAALRPQDVARLLRDPPLQTNTVVGYILEAIKQEMLPFDKKRIRNEVLHLLPRETLDRRFPDIVREAHELDRGSLDAT